MENVGKIVQIIGAVAGVPFARGIPAICNAFEIQVPEQRKFVLENYRRDFSNLRRRQ
jgi:F0F1-type ATP synthase beta subunit